MRIAIGADHKGFELKKHLIDFLHELGFQVVDVGSYSEEPVDYPDIAEAVGLALRGGNVDRGVLICCSGVGASVAATKVPGIRAGLCHDTYSAHQGVEHDDMNILVLGSCVVGLELAKELVRAFVGAKFNGEERHRLRLEKIRALEARYSKQTTSI